MPAAYVKPYAKRGKSDAIDAEAICEAVTRPTMRFVEIKSMDQQAVIMLHRTRDLLIRQRTMLANALRGHLAEFGIVALKGVWRLSDLVATATSAPVCQLPDLARECVELIVTQVEELERRIAMVDRSILAWHRKSEVPRRLETITSSALKRSGSCSRTPSGPAAVTVAIGGRTHDRNPTKRQPHQKVLAMRVPSTHQL